MSHFGEGVDPDSNCGTTYVNYYTANESYMVADTQVINETNCTASRLADESKCLPQ